MYMSDIFPTNSAAVMSMTSTSAFRDEESKRLAACCKSEGFKKITFIMHLIREYLDKETFQVPQDIVGLQLERQSGDKP